MNRSTRGGFSLIEILVALTIMAICMALLLAFLGTTGSAAREASTRATLKKLDSLLQTRCRQIVDSFSDQERKLGSVKNEWTDIRYAAATYLGGSEPAAAKRALAKMNRYKGALPQSMSDVMGPAGWLSSGDTNPRQAAWSACTDPNELLYQILTYGGGAGADSQVKDSINPRHVRYLNVDPVTGNPLNELRAVFLDDWGNPLRFYVSPTRLIRPDGPYQPVTSAQYSLAKTLIPSLPPLPAGPYDFTSLFNQDPLDPRGALRAASPFPSVSPPTPPPPADRYFYSPVASFESNYHTPDTYFVSLIVSAGQDEELGMHEPNETGALRHGAVITSPADRSEAVADNLTSAQ